VSSRSSCSAGLRGELRRDAVGPTRCGAALPSPRASPGLSLAPPSPYQGQSLKSKRRFSFWWEGEVKSRWKPPSKAAKLVFLKSVLSAVRRHPKQSCAATRELGAGRAPHLHPHQLVTPQPCSLSRESCGLGVSPFSKTPKIASLTLTATRPVLLPGPVSLGRSTGSSSAPGPTIAKTFTHPKTHPKGKNRRRQQSASSLKGPALLSLGCQERRAQELCGWECRCRTAQAGAP